MKSLTGQTAVVTGAGRGVGRAVALALAEEGMRVGLVARTESELEAVAAIVREKGGQPMVHVGDLSDSGSTDLVAEWITGLGNIDVLVNNAGAFLEKPVTETSRDEWEHVMRVNLTAPFILSRAALPLMAEAGSGSIINIGSTGSVQGHLRQCAYSASKHGLLGLSRALALEAEPLGVRVQTLCPGGVDTTLIAGTHLAERLGGERVLDPADVAAQVIFLLKQGDAVYIPEITTRRFKGP